MGNRATMMKEIKAMNLVIDCIYDEYNYIKCRIERLENDIKSDDYNLFEKECLKEMLSEAQAQLNVVNHFINVYES